MDSDKKAAWDGAYPGQPEVPIHIEAAAHSGRPVWFEIKGPWAEPAVVSEPGTLVMATTATFLVILVVFVAAGSILVRRNLRLGRGDRRGAFRLAAFSFVTVALALVFRADHSLAPNSEYSLLTLVLAGSFHFALCAWFVYMAAEPAVRRRWPHMLISWSRLLAGCFSDPLVGRDVLLGGLAGLAFLLIRLGVVMPAWHGRDPIIPGTDVLSTLSAPRHLAYFFFRTAYIAAGPYALAWAFGLYLFQTMVRRAWLARVLVFVVFFLAFTAGAEDLYLASLSGVVVVGIMLTVLVRLGPLSLAMMWFVFLVLSHTPLTLDWSVWYAGRSFVMLAFFAVLFAAAFYTSLGGKPLFGRALLED